MNKNKKTGFSTIAPAIVVICLFAYLILQTSFAVTSKTLQYTEFIQYLKDEKIVSVIEKVGDNVVSISGDYKYDGSSTSKYSTTLPKNSIYDEASKLIVEQNLKSEADDANKSNYLWSMIINFAPILVVGLAIYFIISKMASQAAGQNNKAFEFSKSKARIQKNVKTRFTDVAGCDEEKEEMKELIDYLKSPAKFSQMGARIPKGIMMVGSPGTGKTLLAKAVAGEAGVPFYSISGSDFVEMFVGVGASRVRDLFKMAKKTAPCMIFIDEIDAVGRQRGAGMGGGHDEREQTLNQMLVELDGMEDNSGIIVIAATNRPDVLDPALLRPGRFDRQITVSLPDVKGREQILKVHARNKNIDEKVDLEAIARRTPGFSGADLENVLNEAAILTVRFKQDKISLDNIDEAIDRVMMGPAKVSRKYDEKTKKLVAYHEAGHAIIGLNLKDGNIVQKVTIIPRGQAGGYNLFTPKQEKMLNSKNDLIDTITSYMGGRSAEEIFFDDITTGASGDIEAATKIAKDMVKAYGMSNLGPIKYHSDSTNVFLGRDYSSSSDASSQVAYEIDVEVRKIIDACHNRAKDIINQHRDELVKIAEALIVNETLTKEEIDLILKDELVIKDGKLVEKESEVTIDIN